MTEIVSTRNALDGKPRIKGTRVSVEAVWEFYTVKDLSPEEIAGRLPTITVEDVEASIDYQKKHGATL